MVGKRLCQTFRYICFHFVNTITCISTTYPMPMLCTENPLSPSYINCIQLAGLANLEDTLLLLHTSTDYIIIRICVFCILCLLNKCMHYYIDFSLSKANLHKTLIEFH